MKSRFGIWVNRRILVEAVVFVIWTALYLLNPFLRIRFLSLSEARIGQFAQITDYCIRTRRRPNARSFKSIEIGISGTPSNKQLLTMFKRHMPIIHSNLIAALALKRRLVFSPFVVKLISPMANDSHPLYEQPPVLTFTKEEESRGSKLLQQIGVPHGGWFVCFHARDPEYSALHWPEPIQHKGGILNCSISNYVDAMRYVTSRGGYAIRMGEAVSEPLPDLGDPKIIDYATKHRSDFGDIYLSSHCRYFVGCWSGLVQVPTIFNIPVVLTNMLTSARCPSGNQNMMIFKHVWSKQLDRIMSFPEIIEFDIARYETTEEYKKANLVLLENSPKDILEVTQEMDQRVNGYFPATESEDELQRLFHSFWTTNHGLHGANFRIGTAYLKTHQNFLVSPSKGAKCTEISINY